MGREDDGLASENFPEFNRAFYSSYPHQYFRHRLTHLMLVASKDAELAALLDEGVTLGSLEISRAQGAAPRNQTEDQEAAERFVAIEAEILLHHTAETLLRLYLAHRGIPDCPWLELARLRSFSKFKALLKAEFIDETAEARAAHVAAAFLGGDDRLAFTPVPSQEVWESSIRAIDRFLVRFAGSLLSDAHLYNAAKHGLALQASESGVRLELPGMPAFRKGMAIQYLEVKDDSWYQTMAWVESEISAVLVATAADLMEQLWKVARSRYLGEELSHIVMFDESVHDVLRDTARKLRGESPLPVMTASRKAFYNLPQARDIEESE